MGACGQSCTILGIVCGIIASGSFGAPLKSNSVNMCNPDPFVLQTYKTLMCFITSWILLLFGVRFEFSPFGLLSGKIKQGSMTIASIFFRNEFISFF